MHGHINVKFNGQHVPSWAWNGMYLQLLVKFFYVTINLISLKNNQVFLEDTELSRKM